MSSIKEIAQITGVSVSTVSRVLNNPDYKCSKPELRDKIRYGTDPYSQMIKDVGTKMLTLSLERWKMKLRAPLTHRNLSPVTH